MADEKKEVVKFDLHGVTLHKDGTYAPEGRIVKRRVNPSPQSFPLAFRFDPKQMKDLKRVMERHYQEVPFSADEIKFKTITEVYFDEARFLPETDVRKAWIILHGWDALIDDLFDSMTPG